MRLTEIDHFLLAADIFTIGTLRGKKVTPKVCEWNLFIVYYFNGTYTPLGLLPLAQILVSLYKGIK